MDKGYNIFNPLAHSVPIHEVKPREDAFWYELDLVILSKCEGIIMCNGLTSWKESKGCMLEYERALELGLEIREFEGL